MKSFINKHKVSLSLLSLSLLSLLAFLIALRGSGNLNIYCGGFDHTASCPTVNESQASAFRWATVIFFPTVILVVGMLIAAFIESSHKKLVLIGLSVVGVVWIINQLINSAAS